MNAARIAVFSRAKLKKQLTHNCPHIVGAFFACELFFFNLSHLKGALHVHEPDLILRQAFICEMHQHL